MSQSNKQGWFEYASKDLFSRDLIESIRCLNDDNETKSHLIEVLIRDKFNKELGINLVYTDDCEYADLIDENANIYIRVDAECKNYKEWARATDKYFETHVVCIYVGFVGLEGTSIHDEISYDYDLRNGSNLFVIDPTHSNNLTMDLIRLKIHQWCDKKVRLSKFNEKASSE